MANSDSSEPRGDAPWEIPRSASGKHLVRRSLPWLGVFALLALGVGGGLLLGLAGVWHLLRQLDRTVKQLRAETPGLG